ncbi:MAG: PAS domain-containing protein, partial [Acidobacteriota bacterium]
MGRDRSASTETAVQGDVDETEKLRREHQRAMSLADATRDLVAMLELDGRLGYLNPAGRELLGVGDTPVHDVRLLDYYGGDDRKQVRVAMETARHRSWSGRLTLESADGTPRHVMQEMMPGRDVEGRLDHVAIVARDITEAVEARELLERQEDQLRLALATSRVAIWQWDVATDVFKWSDDAADIFGLKWEKVPASQAEYVELVHPDDRARVHRAVAEALAGRRRYRCEHRLLGSDGTETWVEGRGEVTRDERGEPVTLIGVGINVNAPKEAEARLRYRLRFEELMT